MQTKKPKVIKKSINNTQTKGNRKIQKLDNEVNSEKNESSKSNRIQVKKVKIYF